MEKEEAYLIEEQIFQETFDKLNSLLKEARTMRKDLYIKVEYENYDKTIMKLDDLDYREQNMSGIVLMEITDMTNAVNPKRPFDFVGINVENCKRKPYWIETSVNIYKFREVADEGEVAKALYENPIDNPIYKSPFKKVYGDRIVSYGDGGRSTLVVPLYVEENLNIDSTKRQRLAELLHKLGEERNDWNDMAPVMDIIDPDLAPNYNFKFEEKIIYPESYKKHIYAKLTPQELAEESKHVLSLRSQYAWYPTDVEIENGGEKVKLFGPFRHLRKKGNEELYKLIMSVFMKMIPGFKKLNLIKEEGNTNLQVVLKAQKYLIQPNTSYSGKWHVEGKTENIIAAGVYYTQIDEGFESDELIFTHTSAPSEYYANYSEIITDYTVEIKEGTAVVFSNILPHKFLELKNMTDEPLSRLFINFFIVDPDCRLVSFSDVWKKRSLQYMLKQFKRVSPCVREDLIEMMIEKQFLAENVNMKELKEKRSKVREALLKEQSGWGYINYGNCGVVEYFDIFHQTLHFKYKEFNDISQNERI